MRAYNFNWSNPLNIIIKNLNCALNEDALAVLALRLSPKLLRSSIIFLSLPIRI